jgi:hypothetical protein
MERRKWREATEALMSICKLQPSVSPLIFLQPGRARFFGNVSCHVRLSTRKYLGSTLHMSNHFRSITSYDEDEDAMIPGTSQDPIFRYNSQKATRKTLRQSYYFCSSEASLSPGLCFSPLSSAALSSASFFASA